MSFLGTGADLATDLLILAEVLISLLVLFGVIAIKKGRAVGRHRLFMLSTLVLNAIFLVAFLIQDLVKGSNVVARSSAPAHVFWPLLGVHLTIAVSALAIAVASWLIARKGMVRSAGGALDLSPDVRIRHRRVSKYYPWLWGSTLATGLLLYGVVYVFYG